MQLNRGNMESALSNETQDQLIIGPSFTDGYAWALEVFSRLGEIGRAVDVVDILYYKECRSRWEVDTIQRSRI